MGAQSEYSARPLSCPKPSPALGDPYVVLHSNWVLAYFEAKKLHSFIMQLFSADATMFSKINFFLPLKNMKKPPSKVAHN